MADTAYVQSNTCAGICDGFRMVRGNMSFYLLQGPTKLIKSPTWRSAMKSHEFFNEHTFSLVFWVKEPERSLYPPFFHVLMMVRGPKRVRGGGEQRV
jgi:hypothetical protein